MKKLLGLLLVLISLSTFSQQPIPKGSKPVMYVEFGGKGIKFGVVAILTEVSEGMSL